MGQRMHHAGALPKHADSGKSGYFWICDGYSAVLNCVVVYSPKILSRSFEEVVLAFWDAADIDEMRIEFFELELYAICMFYYLRWDFPLFDLIQLFRSFPQ